MVQESNQEVELRAQLHRTLDNMAISIEQLPEGETRLALVEELAELRRILVAWRRASRAAALGPGPA